MDQVMSNAKTEKGPWPETIIEEMDQSMYQCVKIAAVTVACFTDGGEDAGNEEDNLEQIIETVNESKDDEGDGKQSTPIVNRNSGQS